MLQLENETKRTKENHIIQPDDGGLLAGGLTLVTNPGAHYSRIANLKRALSRGSNIRLTSSGGSAGKGSWIRIFLAEPTSLYQILYRMPDVLTVSRKRQEIYITVLPGN